MALKDHQRQPRVAASLLWALARGRLSHAYLFSGPEGSGKSRIALELAKAALCEGRSRVTAAAAAADGPLPGADSCGSCSSCLNVDGGRHPDVEFFRPEEGKVNYPVKQVREEIRHHAYLKPARGAKRFLIIERAEALVRASGQNEGADTLLKLLEEPPPDTVLILLAAHPERLPDTVRSRCQQVRFDRPQADALGEALAPEDGLRPDEALFVAHLAGLDLATARGFLRAKKKDTPDVAATREVLLEIVASLERRPYPDLLALATALDAAARGWAALSGALGVLAVLYRDAAVLAAAGVAVPPGTDRPVERSRGSLGRVLAFAGGPEAEAVRAAASTHGPVVLAQAAGRALRAQEDSRRYPARLLLIEVLLLDLRELFETAGRQADRFRSSPETGATGTLGVSL